MGCETIRVATRYDAQATVLLGRIEHRHPAGEHLGFVDFGKGDTLSILQVVENPGWLIPYISCVLVAVGLIIHFTVSLRKSSRKREAARLVRAKGYAIGNVDSTVIAQAPKLAPHIAAMRQSIAQALGIDLDCVNVKAKTAEKMGPVGEGRAIDARAVVLLVRT
jgi:hypothetical protein